MHKQNLKVYAVKNTDEKTVTFGIITQEPKKIPNNVLIWQVGIFSNVSTWQVGVFSWQEHPGLWVYKPLTVDKDRDPTFVHLKVGDPILPQPNIDQRLELIKRTRTIHLTLTGIYAGTPICNVEKGTEDQYFHLQGWKDFEDPRLCEACKEIALLEPPF